MLQCSGNRRKQIKLSFLHLLFKGQQAIRQIKTFLERRLRETLDPIPCELNPVLPLGHRPVVDGALADPVELVQAAADRDVAHEVEHVVVLRCKKRKS